MIKWLPTDEELYNSVKMGDKKAFNLLYDRYWEILYKKAFSYLHDGEAASEIVNDPVKSSTYPRQGRKSIYHCALSDYMKEYKRKNADELSANADKS